MNLSDNVTSLKYVSNKYSLLLNNLGIFTIKDLLTYFPKKYIDSSNAEFIFDVKKNLDYENEHLIKGTVADFKSVRIRGGMSIQRAIIKDETEQIECNWFNQPFLSNVFKPGKKFFLLGKIKVKFSRVIFYSSIYEEDKGTDPTHLMRITPEYSLTAGVTKKWFRNRIKSLVDSLDVIEIKDEINPNTDFLKNYIKNIHFPESSETLKDSIESLSIYELTNIHLKILKKQATSKKYDSIPLLKNFEAELSKIKETLPFELTPDQKSVLDSIVNEMQLKTPMNILLQGDVGSGKTIIALIVSYLVCLSGFQSVILTPTTILAKQHYETFNKILGNKISIELVTSENQKTSGKQIIIGTSAIFARKDNVLKDAGLVVIDEQHRFGVQQREDVLKFYKDSKYFPHYIDMTATPIPRTIAETFFSDLSVLTIKSKPKDRKPIETRVIPEEKRYDSYKWFEEKVANREQIYWVCPLVNISEKIKSKSVQETYEHLVANLKNVRIGLLHGQLKPSEKTQIMEDFKNHKIDLLVSTTVIEVGVDVPNATIMVIENADRFGLAQLHQIRGRVGRGDKQSWCFLFASADTTYQGIKRLEFLQSNSDGMKIAEFDLNQRGPGEVYGTAQSGIPNLKIAKLNDLDIIRKSKKVALQLFKNKINQISIFS